MNSQVTAIVVISMSGLALIVLVWWFASRKKQEFAESDAQAPVGVGVSVAISAQSSAALKALSPEPILIKQTPDGARAQIDSRPMVPVAIFSDRTVVAALKEVAAEISRQHGMVWVALVAVREDDSLSVTRLS